MSPLARAQRTACLAAGLLVLATSAGAQLSELGDLHGALADDLWGASVAVLGDLDGDGTPDLAVGSPVADVDLGGASLVDAGRVEVYSGATQQLLHAWAGLPGDEFGYAIAGLNDVDLDGVPDVLIGAPTRSTTHAANGTATVFSGATGAALRVHHGVMKDSRLGHALAGGPDYDLDGIGEYAVGSPHESTTSGYGGPNARGVTRIHFGATGTVWELLDGEGSVDAFPQWGTFVRTQFGAALAFVDHDLVVGAPESKYFLGGNYVDDRGLVQRFAGFAWTSRWVRGGTQDGERMGACVAAPGGSQQLDADGVGDVLVGAPGRTQFGSTVGGVDLLAGSDGSVIASVNGSSTIKLGKTVAGLGDVDGDGVPDFAAGAPQSTAAGFGSGGVVRVHSGASLALIQQTASEGVKVAHGSAIAGGDIDGDGLGDLLVGEPYFNAPGVIKAGRARLYVTGCPASWQPLDPGLAGTLGIPRLSALGVPSLGSDFMLDLTSSATGPAAAWLVIGLVAVPLPFKGGLLHTDPLLTVPFPLAAGNSSLPLALPDDHGLCGVGLVLQLVVQDAGAPVGLALSPGMALTLGL